MIINNKLFNLDLGKMTSKEKDLFFLILEKLSMATNREFEMKLFEIKKELGLYKKTDERALNTIRRMCKRFQETAQEIETEDGFEYFNVFEGQKINLKEETFMITLKKEFKYLIDVDSKVKGEKQQGYTIIEDMKELYSIQSSYSKDLYLFIKRWESIGKKEIKIEEFKKMLKVPATYKMHHIDQKIIFICLKDLTVYFTRLNIEKIKNGRKIESLIFTWQRVEKKKKVVQKKKFQEE